MRLRSRRQAVYLYLRQHHLVHREALLLSRLRRNYPALKAMTQQRSKLWVAHTKAMQRAGVGDMQSIFAHRKWLDRVWKFYVKNGWIVDKDTRGRQYKRQQISPWGWYDNVFKKLPPEDSWDTPRGHRKKPKYSNIRMDKIIKLRVIEETRRALRTERDPNRILELQDRLRSLGQ